MFVRNLENLTDAMFGEHLAKLTLMVPEHAIEFPEHARIMHDGDICPQEDVDPFQMPSAISYAQALTQQATEENEEDDLMKNLYSIDTNTSGLDNETREL